MERQEAQQVFAERLRLMRERRALSIQQVAELAKVPYHTVYRLERGAWSPRLDIAAQLARALGADLNWLAGLYDEREGTVCSW